MDVLSKAFLGMTVSCARCHNHKFDAISQADFYALFGVLESCRPAIIQADTPGREASKREQLAELKQRIEAELAAGWRAAIDDLAARFDRAIAADQAEADELEQLEASPPEAADDPADKKKLAERKKKWEADRNRLRDRRRARRDPGHPLAVLYRLADAADGDRDRLWQTLRQQATAAGELPQADRGGLPPPKTWYASGNGLAGATPDGAFRVEPEGERVLTGLLPAGIHSNLVVSSAGGVLHSPQFAIDGRPIRMLVAGAGGARGRIVIWNYPRALGLNYFRTVTSPVKRPTLNWQQVKTFPSKRSLASGHGSAYWRSTVAMERSHPHCHRLACSPCCLLMIHYFRQPQLIEQPLPPATQKPHDEQSRTGSESRRLPQMSG
ncbi:MAG: DUF1549 domain-containing protein [Planctomycetia bacterium]|nr:DUF1549 domain-containing protein [Planctomycetia bacterium]